MLRVKAMAECVSDYLVGHHAAVPGVCKAAQGINAARRLKKALHAAILTRPGSCKEHFSVPFKMEAAQNIPGRW